MPRYNEGKQINEGKKAKKWEQEKQSLGIGRWANSFLAYGIQIKCVSKLADTRRTVREECSSLLDRCPKIYHSWDKQIYYGKNSNKRTSWNTNQCSVRMDKRQGVWYNALEWKEGRSAAQKWG